MAMKSAFSVNMVIRRKEMGFTQEKAAKYIGVNRSNLGAYEEGRAFPKPEVLVIIFEKYGVKDIPSFLLGVDACRRITDVSEKDMLYQSFHQAENVKQRAVKILLGIE